MSRGVKITMPTWLVLADMLSKRLGLAFFLAVLGHSRSSMINVSKMKYNDKMSRSLHMSVYSD
jgi:hypothetical protein